MRTDEQSNRRHPVLDVAVLIGQVLLVLVLICAIVVGSFSLSRWISPWVGAVSALLGLVLWGRFGPRPMPGFFSGLLCICGYANILYTFVVCVILGIRELLA